MVSDMRVVGFVAAVLVMGMLPVAAGQVPSAPAPAEDAVQVVCDVATRLPVPSDALDTVGLCPGEDAQAGPQAHEDAQTPVADAQAEELQDTATELPAMAEAFAEEVASNPTAAPARAPGFVDEVATWFGRFAHALGDAVGGLGDTAGKAAKGAAEGLGGVGLGLGEAAKGVADAVGGAAHQAGNALGQLGDAVSQAISSLLPHESHARSGGVRLPARAPGGSSGLPAKDLMRTVEDALPGG